jgi:hypothetical protein
MAACFDFTVNLFQCVFPFVFAKENAPCEGNIWKLKDASVNMIRKIYKGIRIGSPLAIIALTFIMQGNVFDGVTDHIVDTSPPEQDSAFNYLCLGCFAQCTMHFSNGTREWDIGHTQA